MAIIDAELQASIDDAWGKSPDDLLVELGMASDSEGSLANQYQQLVRAQHYKSASGLVDEIKRLLEKIFKRGKSTFDVVWPQIRKFVCAVNRDGYEDKALAAIIVEAVVAAFNIANPIVVLVVTYAVKEGLTKLCEGVE
jgi:hypothetical protein